MRLTTILASLLISSVLVLTPSSADSRPYGRWERSSICVEPHVSIKRWKIRSAVHQWNSTPATNFYIRSRCSGDFVSIKRRPLNGYLGMTYIRYLESGTLLDADIVLDASAIMDYPKSQRRCLRRYTLIHEMGHALGLAHYTKRHSGSVMSYQGWYKPHCGRLTAHDRSDAARLYAR